MSFWKNLGMETAVNRLETCTLKCSCLVGPNIPNPESRSSVSCCNATLCLVASTGNASSRSEVITPADVPATLQLLCLCLWQTALISSCLRFCQQRPFADLFCPAPVCVSMR